MYHVFNIASPVVLLINFGFPFKHPIAAKVLRVAQIHFAGNLGVSAFAVSYGLCKDIHGVATHKNLMTSLLHNWVSLCIGTGVTGLLWCSTIAVGTANPIPTLLSIVMGMGPAVMMAKLGVIGEKKAILIMEMRPVMAMAWVLTKR